jgi:hypothetical protein
MRNRTRSSVGLENEFARSVRLARLPRDGGASNTFQRCGEQRVRIPELLRTAHNAARNLLRGVAPIWPCGGPKPSFHSRVTSDVTPGGASAPPEALLAAPPARVRRPRSSWGDRVFGWGYDCGRCGARVRGLDDGRVSCQRCLAPVTCRAIDTARQPEVSDAGAAAA